jgi:hypothetical protein
MDAYAELQQHTIERLGLGTAIISVHADETLVSIHRQVATQELWCVESSLAGGIGACSLGTKQGVVGGLMTERRRIVCGTVPIEAHAAEVTTDMDQNVQTYMAEDVFVTLVPPTGVAIVSFKNAQGFVIRVQPVPAFQPPPAPRMWSRIREWVHNLGLMPIVRGNYTYPK